MLDKVLARLKPGSIKVNAAFGFLGFLIPTLIIFLSYPILLHHLGEQELGLYILSTSLSGAWAVLDFGVAAATLKYVASDIERGDKSSAGNVVVTALCFYGVVGLMCSLLIWSNTDWLIDLMLVPDDLREECSDIFRIAAVRFSFFFITLVFISIMKAFELFQLSSIILIVMSTGTFGGAAAGVALFDIGLVGMSLIGLLSNLITLLLSWYISVRLLGKAGVSLLRGRFSTSTLKRIIAFGSFSAINGMVPSLITQVQRFLVAGYLGPAAVTIFAISSTILSKGQQAMLAIFEFLVPWGSKIQAIPTSRSRGMLRSMFAKTSLISILIAVTAYTGCYLVGEVIITSWLRSGISDQIYQITMLMMIGFVGWSTTVAGFHIVNGLGKPWLNTMFLILSPFTYYIGLLYFIYDSPSLTDFALAYNLAMLLHAALYVTFLLCRGDKVLRDALGE